MICRMPRTRDREVNRKKIEASIQGFVGFGWIWKPIVLKSHTEMEFAVTPRIVPRMQPVIVIKESSVVK